jgi:hypothetical protein
MASLNSEEWVLMGLIQTSEPPTGFTVVGSEEL